jgi:hypothetical protein
VAKAQKQSIERANARILDGIKDIVHAQLGVYGAIYDELNARVAKVKVESPKQWHRFVNRGEKVRNDLERAREGVRLDLEKVRSDLQRRFDRAQLGLRRKVEKIQAA